MKRLNFGLAVALALTALATTTQAFAAPNIQQAQALVSAAQIPCTVTDARAIDGLSGSNGDPLKIYEAACQEGLGYVVIDKNGADPARSADCLHANQPDAKGNPSAIACKLPGNKNPAAALQPIIAKTGSLCEINKARFIASTNDGKNIYEVACKDGEGFILFAPKVAGAPAASTANCLAAEKSPALQCTLTTHEQRLAIVDSLIAESGKSCVVKDKRYVAETTSGETFYEVACADGKGYMVGSDKTGKLGETVSCTQTGGFAGGCKLTDARQAETEESGLYSRLAQQAGFNCQVAKYSVYLAKSKTMDVVELQCANRPDGGVGFFPASGQPRVLDCLRAPSQGYNCSMTPTSALYSKLSAQLVAMHRSSCVVSNARPYPGTTSTSDFVEVACADGAPGWVIEYPTMSDQPKGALNCVQAGNLGGGGCQLPGNRPSR